MRKIFLIVFSILSLSTSAKSIVFTLNDKVGTRVYVRIDTDEAPKMVMNGDGTFTLNGNEYAFSNIKCFEVSKTDYSGEKNTIDAIDTMEQAPQMCLQNGCVILGSERQRVSIYTLDGKLLQTLHNVKNISIESLPKGVSVISDGVSTLKIQR